MRMRISRDAHDTPPRVQHFSAFHLCISTIVISIRNTVFVRCREVVRFSEGPLWEVRLYFVCITRALCNRRLARARRLTLSAWLAGSGISTCTTLCCKPEMQCPGSTAHAQISIARL